ncbi:metal-dependent hydrolase [Selenomonas sp. oral taxon 126]|uniref:MBL fold metallo-hydrolase n=1 Tax=Selenomonas sp. oral taxon 126 TaxID=712528 RepID=UPI0008077A04|nr:MBL fold metallo-hydrolase [Selenomonas sp. oral taxon 126]ANR71379.1 metal-dependent hydrolase [Selenomonas sp. oral taxon 126]
MEVTYLLNSGFLVRVDDVLLVFDAFDDPAGVLPQSLEHERYERLYFFASHAHFDHFNPNIARFAAKVTRYLLSEDIRVHGGASLMPPEQTSWIGVYDSWQDDRIAVTSFSSTDEGTSFLVEVNGKAIFHAGDFNWWDWTGDTRENRKLAENGFRKQMKRLAGRYFDLAFFPVDGRLGPSMERGAKVFCAETHPKALVTMHSVGYPAWQPSADFFEEGREIPVWSPQTAGEQHSF